MAMAAAGGRRRRTNGRNKEFGSNGGNGGRGFTSKMTRSIIGRNGGRYGVFILLAVSVSISHAFNTPPHSTVVGSLHYSNPGHCALSQEKLLKPSGCHVPRTTSMTFRGKRPSSFCRQRPTRVKGSTITAPTILKNSLYSQAEVVINSKTDTTKVVEKDKDIQRFEEDVAKVLTKKRSEGDQSLPVGFSREKATKLSYTNIWSEKMWERYISPWRYIRYVKNIGNSRLLRFMAPQLLLLTAWSALTVTISGISAGSPIVTGVAQRLRMPLTPLSLLSTFIAALLTLRSNQGLSRLAEGRLAWGRTILLTRDTAQLFAAYIYPNDKELGLLAARQLSMFGWLLKARLREEDDTGVITTMLPPVDARFVQSQRKRPVAIITRLRQIVAHKESQGLLGSSAHKAFEHNFIELNRVYGQTERIKGSPIPPLYTSHMSRLLFFYLFFLPIALNSMQVMTPYGVVLASAAVGYAMLGLDEISHQLEQPFRTIPMQQLATVVMLDVADTVTCLPPPLPGGEQDEENTYSEGQGTPLYW